MEGQSQNHKKAHLHAINNLHAKFHEKGPRGSISFLVYKKLIPDRQTDKVITVGYHISIRALTRCVSTGVSTVRREQTSNKILNSKGTSTTQFFTFFTSERVVVFQTSSKMVEEKGGMGRSVQKTSCIFLCLTWTQYISLCSWLWDFCNFSRIYINLLTLNMLKNSFSFLFLHHHDHGCIHCLESNYIITQSQFM